MLNPELKDRYQVTEKVAAQKFRNNILGVVDLGTISEEVAEKLVKSGHLTKVKPKAKKSED